MNPFEDDAAARPSWRAPFLVPAALGHSLAREGAVIALRMIEGQRWHQRLLDRNGIRDNDILSLIGLEPSNRSEGPLSVAEFREAVAQQRKRLERNLRTGNDLLARNINRLGDILKLNPTERAVLRLAVVATRISQFNDLFHHTIHTERDLLGAIHKVTGCRIPAVRAALATDRTLRRSGFFESSSFVRYHNPVALDDALVNALLAQKFDEVTLLRRLVRPAPAPTLSMADFAHLPDLAVIQRYLADAVKRRRKGVNILLYGVPGTGKTEFVRALPPALNIDLHEVPNQDSDGDPVSGRRRFSAYHVCQHILASRRRQILLFDEVEDVFGGGDSAMSALFAAARDPEQLRKSWVNETLESNPVPAIWVCNSIGGIDAAFLRRFDLVVEFRTPSRSVRRRLLDRYFRNGEISNGCAERLAQMEHLSPAQVERSARVLRSLGTRDLAQRDAEVERMLTASLRAMGYRQSIPPPALPSHYDPAFLNTDRDLEAIANGLSGGNARLCLYGVPGTGKTAFAHYLGRRLNRPVLVKRGSDLRSMWVGQTEAQIAAAFAEARDDNAILVIDEADGFLRDRNGAAQGFEVNAVNELLTQMEAFDGIFIASTNLLDTLDAAALRRFDFKVKFDYLSRDQRRALLRSVATDGEGDCAATGSAFERLDRLQHLTPGDFANALRQLRVTGQAASAESLVDLLNAESRIKPEGRVRSIGFTAM